MRGTKAKQFARVVETRWLSLGDAVDLVLEQWEVLEAYFREEANASGPDAYAVRQLFSLYTAKNKIVITFVADRIRGLNNLNKAFQGEQPSQAKLLNHLLNYYYGILDTLIPREGLELVKKSVDPLNFDFHRYLRDVSRVHFG